MPIIEPINEPGAPLSQGDILKGVRLFTTTKSWVVDGGKEAVTNDRLCLVLSRPCTAARDDLVVVAAIEQYKNKPPAQFATFEDALRFFTLARDGPTTPDQFYIGQVTGYQGVFCACFDSLHTVQIPKVSTPERQAFLAANRVAKLNADFAHDLHLRLFRAFASLGFDDQRWFATDDLRALIAVADRDAAQFNVKLAEANAKLQVGLAQGYQHQAARQKDEKEARELQEKIDAFAKEIGPYKDELTKREAIATPQKNVP